MKDSITRVRKYSKPSRQNLALPSQAVNSVDSDSGKTGLDFVGYHPLHPSIFGWDLDKHQALLQSSQVWNEIWPFYLNTLLPVYFTNQPSSWWHHEGYIPSRPRASPTHLLVMAAAISGTMYSSPPVSSNMITTSDTATPPSQPSSLWSLTGTMYSSPKPSVVRCSKLLSTRT